jgi:hypothetical protein
MTEIVRDCPCCGSAREFSQIHSGPGRCPDSYDGCCPEWFCTACDTAVRVGVPQAARPLSTAGRLDRVA